MKKLGDLTIILDLHRQGLKVAVIARQIGIVRRVELRYDPKNAFATIFNLDQDSLIRLIRAKRWR